MVVSIALLGLGAAGSVQMLGDTGGRPRIRVFAPLGFGVSVIPVYLTSQWIPWDPVRIRWEAMQVGYLFLQYLVLAVPFFFAGWTLARVYRIRADKINRLYFSDLLGAGFGAAVSAVLPVWIGGEGIIPAVSLLGFLSSWCFARASSNTSGSRCAIGGVFLVLLILLIRPEVFDLSLSPYRPLSRALGLPGASTLVTQWNSYSRIDLVSSPSFRVAPGLSLAYTGTVPRRHALFVDGGKVNPLMRPSRPAGSDQDSEPAGIAGEEYLDFLLSSLSYAFGRRKKVLVLEPGGGTDVLLASRKGAREIVVIEPNRLVREVAGEYAPGLFRLPGVSWRGGNPRSELLRLDQEYDLILLNLLDPLGAGGAGMHALTEDHRLTVESIRTLIRHLTPEGVLAVSQYLIPPPRAELRFTSLLVEAIAREGGDPARQILAARGLEVISQIAKRSPFRDSEIESIEHFLGEKGFLLLYTPASEEENRERDGSGYPLASLISRVIDSETRENFYEDYLFDVRPVTDDRPFFHQYFRIRKISEVFRSTGGKWTIFFEGGYLLPFVFLVSLLASAGFILLPLFVSSPGGTFSPGTALRLGYFICIGAGFILVEISFIQKWIFFLGHPGQAIPLVLTTLLIAAGSGSVLFGKRCPSPRGRFPAGFLVVTGGAVLAAGLGSGLLFRWGWACSVPARIMLAIIFLVPPGLLLGIPFPLGIRFLYPGDASREIPWAWAVNGFASVTGSVAAPLLAISFGFTANFGFAAAAYCLAGLAGWSAFRRH